MQAIQTPLRLGFAGSSVSRISRAPGSAIVRSLRSQRATLFGATPSLAASAACVKPARILSRRSVGPSTRRPVPMVYRRVNAIAWTVFDKAVDGGRADPDVLPRTDGWQMTAADELVNVLLRELENLRHFWNGK